MQPAPQKCLTNVEGLSRKLGGQLAGRVLTAVDCSVTNHPADGRGGSTTASGSFACGSEGTAETGGEGGFAPGGVSRVRRACTATARLDRSDLCRPGLDRVSVPTMTATSAARPVGVGTVENRFGISWRRRHSETVRAPSCPTVSKANVHRREADGQQGWGLEIPTVS